MLSNYHTHTKRCRHATGEDREYVEAAIEAGYQTLGFSDHCPWVYPDDYVSNIRMTLSQVDDYFTSLRSLREEYKSDIRLLIGFEAEYIESLMEAQDGFLRDYPLDYMILGQHFVGEESNANYAGNRTDRPDMLKGYVDLCIRGMRSGRYRYLAHPDLIYFTGNEDRYDREMRRLCRAMKELNAPLELNVLGLATGRNYPNPRFWKIVEETGNQVVIGMDAHSPESLLDIGARKKAEAFCRNMNLVSL